MNPSPVQSHFVRQHCLGAMESKVPQLRAALTRSDETTIRGLAHELRNTLGLLGLPRLFQLSQDIEYRRADLGSDAWQNQCDHFCDLLERIHRSLQEQHQALN